jgi:adsorption protein B
MPAISTILPFAEAIGHELALFAAVGFALAALSDCAVDLIWIGSTARRKLSSTRASRLYLDNLPPASNAGFHAVFVPAWDEADVIGPMLLAMTERWAGQNMRIFVGCYPNDPGSILAVQSVIDNGLPIVLVLNRVPGPTTKADCLNTLWRALVRDEKRSFWPCKSVILHDAEDLVHRAELRIMDSLIEQYDLVQIPVLPVASAESPWVSGHYCDEFAQSHTKDMMVRSLLAAGLPSAGVGCAIGRDMLGKIANWRGDGPFDATSITEDYELGLTIAQLGGIQTFARVHDENNQLIAVRECFPLTLNEAVRQKSRWTAGIALHGWDRLGWGQSVADLWMRWRDRRAILSAMVLCAAYLSMLAGSVLLLADLTGGFTLGPLPAALSLLLCFNLAILGWRLFMRMVFSTKAYGWRHGIWAIPRAFVANIIAIMAARRAVSGYFRTEWNQTPYWEKTDHRFPETGSLR